MKKWIAGITVLFLTVVLVGCAANRPEAGEDRAYAANEKSGKKILVGTGTQFPNVCFIDENGKLTGFDVELVKELDRRLPEYEFEFKTMDFSSLLLSLETKKIDIVAHQMVKNPDREAKYLFNKEPYNIFPDKVVVDKNNDTIKSIDDLKGKKVYATATSNGAYILEQYNKKHGNAIDIVYSNGGANDSVTQIQSGRVAAKISTEFAIRFDVGKDGKPALKTVGESLADSNVLFVLRKDSQELADKLDETIRALKADGTLSELSKKWLGEDYTQSSTSAN